MIVLDTNVISETTRPKPSESVRRWFARQSPTELYTTAITEAELLFGVERMPGGKKRMEAERANRYIVDRILMGRVLPFDRNAAREYASIASQRHRIGLPISEADAQIAAIARSHGASIATRNARDFTHCGIDIIDPWTMRD